MKFVARILFIFNSRSLISFATAGNDIYIADCYSDTDLSKPKPQHPVRKHF